MIVLQVYERPRWSSLYHVHRGGLGHGSRYTSDLSVSAARCCIPWSNHLSASNAIYFPAMAFRNSKCSCKPASNLATKLHSKSVRCAVHAYPPTNCSARTPQSAPEVGLPDHLGTRLEALSGERIEAICYAASLLRISIGEVVSNSLHQHAHVGR